MCTILFFLTKIKQYNTNSKKLQDKSKRGQEHPNQLPKQFKSLALEVNK